MLARSASGDVPLDSMVGALRRRFGAVRLVVVYLVLLNLVPPELVLPGLGGVGRPAVVVTLGMLVWWGYTRALPTNRSPRFVAIRWAMVVYLMVVFLSMIAGIDRGLPGVERLSMDRYLIFTLGFVGLVMVLIDEIRSIGDLERLLWWTLVLSGVAAAVGVVQFVTGIDVTSSLRIPGLRVNHDSSILGQRGSGGFARVRGLARHPIEFGVLMATVLPIGLSLCMTGHQRRTSTVAATVLVGIAIPLSISRSAILGLVAGMAVFALGWTWRQRANAAAIGVAAMMAFQVVTPGLLGTIKSLFRRVGTDNSISGRTEDYDAVGDYITERPWLGRGAGTFLPDEYRVLDNEYLGTLLEMGVAGLGSLCLIFLCSASTAIWLARRGGDERVMSHGRALGAAIAVAMITFATFDALAFPIYGGVLMFIFGCLGALYRLAAEAAESTDKTLPAPAMVPDGTDSSG